MPPANRIPDDEREAIANAIRAGKPRNEIAREFSRSAGTVSNIATEYGLTDAFDRSATKNATEARQADNRARRAELSSRLLVKAGQLLDDMDAPAIVWNIGGKDNVYTEHQMPKPPTGDLRNLMVTAATAIDKHVVLEKVDADTGAETAGSLLGSLLDDLIERHGDSPEAG
jgi:transposase-like protein